jgi:pilus assembly protein CpaF
VNAGSRSEPLFDQVRNRLARDGSVDISGAVAAARRESQLLADDTVLAEWDHELAARLTGAGPLEQLLELPGVTDVLVNGPQDVWLDRGAGLERASVGFASEADVRALAYRLAASAGRRLDDAAPFVDAHLPDGTRLHAVIPPLTAATTVSLRVLARRRLQLGDLIRAGTLSAELADVVRAVIATRLAFVISGGTGSGKTTVLGALLGQVPPDQRIVIIEDAAEITTSHRHVVRLLARAPNIEGAGEIGLRDLVRQALRMRPDRVVVGEFRGAEVVELLAALNTGHAGGGATVHANGMHDVPARLEALGALGGLDRGALTAQAAAALDVVIHLERDLDGRRHVMGLGWLVRDGDELRVRPVWTPAGLGSGAAPLAAEIGRRSRGAVPALLADSAGPAALPGLTGPPGPPDLTGLTGAEGRTSLADRAT